MSSAAWTSPRGSWGVSALVPRTMHTALSFFLPMTAPQPFLEATCP